MAQQSILAWLLIGLAIGGAARLLVPGRDPGGLGVAVLIGMAGALLAGVAVQVAGYGANTAAIGHVAAVLGAVGLLWLYRRIVARRA